MVGPFGSGRTTTLTSLIDKINREETRHILTVERPVEFLHVDDRSIIEQVEVETDVETFEGALNFVVGEDIDVVLLSEVPNKTVVEGMLRLVNSGRLVYANLDTDSSVATIQQIVSLFDPAGQANIQTQLGDKIAAIVAQRMLPRIGGGRVVAAEIVLPNEAVHPRGRKRLGKFR